MSFIVKKHSHFPVWGVYFSTNGTSERTFECFCTTWKEDAANRIATGLNAFQGIPDPETWMKTNREHIEGLLKGGAQNADVAIKAGERIAELEKLLEQAITQKEVARGKANRLEEKVKTLEASNGTLLIERSNLNNELSKEKALREAIQSDFHKCTDDYAQMKGDLSSQIRKQQAVIKAYEDRFTELIDSWYQRLKFLFNPVPPPQK